MKLGVLETVVLKHDITEAGLREGDIGTVVEIYPGGGCEVEFVRVSGVTQALLTLEDADVRKVDADDLLSTRRLAEAR